MSSTSSSTPSSITLDPKAETFVPKTKAMTYYLTVHPKASSGHAATTYYYPIQHIPVQPVYYQPLVQQYSQPMMNYAPVPHNNFNGYSSMDRQYNNNYNRARSQYVSKTQSDYNGSYRQQRPPRRRINFDNYNNRNCGCNQEPPTRHYNQYGM